MAGMSRIPPMLVQPQKKPTIRAISASIRKAAMPLLHVWAGRTPTERRLAYQTETFGEKHQEEKAKGGRTPKPSSGTVTARLQASCPAPEKADSSRSNCRFAELEGHANPSRTRRRNGCTPERRCVLWENAAGRRKPGNGLHAGGALSREDSDVERPYGGSCPSTSSNI